MVRRHGNRIITLLTDYGTRDGYAGALKGAILSVNPNAHIIDIAHDIDAYDIPGAAYVLWSSVRAFPRETIHLAVVDPGVGGQRRPIVVLSDGHCFVGPDNGLFSYMLDRSGSIAYHLNRPRYFATRVSSTFHGRDIFAPVAARLSLGTPPSRLGSRIKDCVASDLPRLSVAPGRITGHVVHIDRFGNVITNIDRLSFGKTVGSRPFVIRLGKARIKRILNCYPPETGTGPFGIFGSQDNLEISAPQAGASDLTGARAGMRVEVRVAIDSRIFTARD